MTRSCVRPLVHLAEGVPYTPGPDEYVITEQHSLEDVLRHLATEAGPDGCKHLIEILTELEEVAP